MTRGRNTGICQDQEAGNVSHRTCPECGGKKAYYARTCMGCRGPTSHGLSYTPEYRAWQQMRLRCLDPKHKAYPSYGGRGITVCQRWLESPQAFLDDMGPKPSPLHELDREDNNGNYEPGNCRWVTRSVNDRNRRSSRFLEFRGESRTVAEWCELLGLSPSVVGHRLQDGWDPERALSTPVRPKAPNGSAKRKVAA